MNPHYIPEARARDYLHCNVCNQPLTLRDNGAVDMARMRAHKQAHEFKFYYEPNEYKGSRRYPVEINKEGEINDTRSALDAPQYATELSNVSAV